VMMESRLAESREFERKGKEDEVVRVDLVTKKNEIRMLRAKLDKEREKVNHLTEKLDLVFVIEPTFVLNNEIMHFLNLSLYLRIYTKHFPLLGNLKADLPQHHIHLASRMNGQTLTNM